MTSLEESGFELHPGIFDSAEIERFGVEADRLSAAAGSASVRFLTERSPFFRSVSTSDRIRAFVGANRVLVRSILFDKTPEENWPVLWHQDLTIAVEEEKEVEGYTNWSVKEEVPHVQPPLSVLEGMITVRIHLDETPAENGALCVLPESHRHGRIDPASIPSEVEKGGRYVCACGPGDVLLMSPLILHSSPRSKQPGRRRVLHFEYAVANSLHPSLRWRER